MILENIILDGEGEEATTDAPATEEATPAAAPEGEAAAPEATA